MCIVTLLLRIVNSILRCAKKILKENLSLTTAFKCGHAASFYGGKLINEEIQLPDHADDCDSQYCSVYENSLMHGTAELFASE